jgi:phosphate transport system permease protein
LAPALLAEAAVSDRVVTIAGLIFLAAPVALLAGVFVDLLVTAAPQLRPALLLGSPSVDAAHAGLLPALAGSALIIVIAGALAVPAAIAAAIYLEEYARPTRLWRLVSANIDTLAGVPSVVYGVIGLTVFVRALGLGRSLISAALTMAMLVLPLCVVSAREALRQVPGSLREAAFALGATKLDCVRYVVLPLALPNVASGVTLALARGLGETAPLLAICGLGFVSFVPASPSSPVTALPLQIYAWLSRPESAFAAAAAAAILTLLACVFLLNGAAIWLRIRAERTRF